MQSIAPGSGSCSKMIRFGGRGPVSKGQGMFGDQFNSSPVKRLRSGGAPGLQTAPPNCQMQMSFPPGSPRPLQPKPSRLWVKFH